MEVIAGVSKASRIRAIIVAVVLVVLAGFNIVSEHYMSAALHQGEGVMQQQPLGDDGSPVTSPDDNQQWSRFVRQVKVLDWLLIVNALLIVFCAAGLFLWKWRTLVIAGLAISLFLQYFATRLGFAVHAPAVPHVYAFAMWYIILVMPLGWPYFVQRNGNAVAAQ